MGKNDGTYDSPKKKSPVLKQREFVFINHDLSREEKDELRAMEDGEEFPLSAIYDLLADGYQVKLAPEGNGKPGYRAHILDDGVFDPSRLVCLSGRGSTPERAWAAVAYRHFHLAQGDWSYFRLSGGGVEDYG